MSIWQTKSWQEMLKKSGQVSEFFEINNIFIEKRKVALGEFGLFVLGLENELNEKNINDLIKLCKKEKCLFIQFETLNYNGKSEVFINSENSRFINGYYKKFITPYTAIIDLEKSEENILKEMKPKGRYNIKLALKKGVEVKEVKKTKENIREFYKLMTETTSRDKFSGNSLQYYEIFLNTLDNSSLLLAYFDDKIISAGIFIFDKDLSIYYYGASTSDKAYRNFMAPYLLQWEAIKKAKSINSKIYDFLGISSPLEKNSSLSGVTDFKLKLTKDIRAVSESYIFLNKKFKYYFIELLKKIMK